MHVKLIRSHTYDNLEKRINDFLEGGTYKVYDIKLSATPAPGMNYPYVILALIMYDPVTSNDPRNSVNHHINN